MDLTVLKNALQDQKNIRKLLKSKFKKLLAPYEIQVKNSKNKHEIEDVLDKLYNYLNEQGIDTDNTYIFMFEDYCTRSANTKNTNR